MLNGCPSAIFLNQQPLVLADPFWYLLESPLECPEILLGGSWAVISMVISLLIWVITIVTLLITPLITTHDPPSTGSPLEALETHEPPGPS